MDEKVILLVEDNPDDEALTLRALQRCNFCENVVVARDGSEALDYLFGSGVYTGRTSSALPVIVMLDIKLPKINGLEVLKTIRSDSRTSLLPVVMLTSSDEERDLLDSYRMGANSYVRKPVVFTQFQNVIEQIGIYWVMLNHVPSGIARE
ncbi:response regulator [bacterium]|nr:response regulator [bacterium]